jgi:hypothetical protein
MGCEYVRDVCMWAGSIGGGGGIRLLRRRPLPPLARALSLSTCRRETMIFQVICLCFLASSMLADGLDNGAAITPPLGWQSWNANGANFNATLFVEQAVAMKNNGLLAAGYTLISVGGSTYKHQGIGRVWVVQDFHLRMYWIPRLRGLSQYTCSPIAFLLGGSYANGYQCNLLSRPNTTLHTVTHCAQGSLLGTAPITLTDATSLCETAAATTRLTLLASLGQAPPQRASTQPRLPLALNTQQPRNADVTTAMMEWQSFRNRSEGWASRGVPTRMKVGARLPSATLAP